MRSTYFHDENKKREFIKAAKKAKVSAQSYGYTDKSGPIYVDEQLTKQTFLLFKRAKELKRQGFKFVWISNGEILVRESETSPVIRITAESQIIEIENEILLSKKNTKGDKRNPKQEKKINKKNKNKPSPSSSSNGNQPNNHSK